MNTVINEIKSATFKHTPKIYLFFDFKKAVTGIFSNLLNPGQRLHRPLLYQAKLSRP